MKLNSQLISVIKSLFVLVSINIWISFGLNKFEIFVVGLALFTYSIGIGTLEVAIQNQFDDVHR